MPSKYDNTYTAYIVHDNTPHRTFIGNVAYGVTTAKYTQDISKANVFFRKSQAWSVASSLNRSDCVTGNAKWEPLPAEYAYTVTPVRIKRRTAR